MRYEDIIKRGLELGLEEIELYAQNSEGNTVKLFNGELSNYNSSITFGMSIRGLYNGKMGYVYTETVEEAAIEELLHQLIENAKSLTSDEVEHVYPGGSKYQDVEELKADYHEHSLTEKVDLLKELSANAKAKDPRIVQVGYCQYVENSGKVRIMNSKGLNLERNSSYMAAVLGVVATDGKQTTMGFAQDINTKFAEIEKERLVKESSESALGSLGAGSVESGQYPVVFNRDVTTDLIQAFASVFAGESALRKVSILVDKIGEKVFGDNINIIDDPFYKNAIIKSPFDDEGVPCYAKHVVENGVFKGFLHSLKTAKFFNTEPTGNGFKPGVAGSITTMPTNLYLEPGKLSEDEIIATVEKGIYVTEVNGLHAGLNPISGAFNVQASGYMIENGKKTNPITLFVISGNFYEMMNDVEHIGSNLSERFVSVAAPTIKVNKLMVSGK